MKRMTRFVSFGLWSVLLTFAQVAGAAIFTLATNGNWNTQAFTGGDSQYPARNTWGTGIVPVPPTGGTNGATVYFPWSNDIARIVSPYTNRIHYHQPWGGLGVATPTNMTIEMRGGTLYLGSLGGVAPAVVNSPIKVWTNSFIQSVVAPTAQNCPSLNGPFSDYDGSHTGTITLAGSGVGFWIASSAGIRTGDNSGFSGGWILGNNTLKYGWKTAYSSGAGVLGTGPVSVDGGSTEFYGSCGTLPNAFVLGAGGATLGCGGAGVSGSATFGGPISGPGRLTTATGNNGSLTLTNGANSFVGLRKAYGTETHTIATPGAQGVGSLTVEAGTLALNATPNATWTITNAIAGSATLKVEDGANTDILTIQAPGAVTPGNFAGTNGTLTVDGNFAWAKDGATPAQFIVDVRGRGSNDQFVVLDGTAAALAASLPNCELVVNLGTLTESDLAGMVVTGLVANSVNFATAGYTFGSQTWNSSCGLLATVQYQDGQITLTDFRRGTRGTFLIIR